MQGLAFVKVAESCGAIYRVFYWKDRLDGTSIMFSCTVGQPRGHFITFCPLDETPCKALDQILFTGRALSRALYHVVLDIRPC